MIDQEWMERNQKEVELLQQQTQQNQVAQDTQAFDLREQQKSLLDYQLSLANELEMIENLLRGRMLTVNEDGVTQWADPEDPDMIILSKNGVHLIMNTISFYLNKNTLLSNYDEDMIYSKMEDFSTALADFIYMDYQKIFQFPSDEECRTKLKARIDTKVKRRRFAAEILGKDFDEQETTQEFWNEVENHIEKELAKIKEQMMKDKLKRFELLMREVQDFVHSTYLRALYGIERRTIRQHIHTSESIGQPKMPTGQTSPKRGMSKWFGR